MHFTTDIIVIVGVLLIAALLFCLVKLIGSTSSLAGTRKKLVKLAPDSELLKASSVAKNAAQASKPEKAEKPKKAAKTEKKKPANTK